MKLKQILLFAFTLLTGFAYSQNLQMSVKLNVSGVSSNTGPNFTFGGIVVDDNGVLNASDVMVGDSVFYLEEGIIYPLVITTKNMSSGSSLNITCLAGTPSVVDAPSGSISGQVAISRKTFTGYCAVPPGLNASLAAAMENRFKQQIDLAIVNAQEIAFTSGSGVPNSTVATSQGYRLAKNMGGDGDLYRWNGSSWVLVGGSSITFNDTPTIDFTGTSTVTADVKTQAIDSTHIKVGGIELEGLSRDGASLNQVIKWNGSNWIPQKDANTTYDIQPYDNVIGVDRSIDGNLNEMIGLFLQQQGATTGQSLKWNGTTWTPQNDNDNQTATTVTATPVAPLVGTTVQAQLNELGTKTHNPVTVTDNSQINLTITGQDLTANIISNTLDSASIKDKSLRLLELNQSGATTGQTPVWDGSKWIAQTNLSWKQYQTTKAILGSDSSFVHDPTVDTTFIKGTLDMPSGSFLNVGGYGSVSPYGHRIRAIDDGGSAAIGVFRGSTNTFGPKFEFFKCRGTTSSPLAVSNNDILGTISFFRHNGTSYTNGASIFSKYISGSGGILSLGVWNDLGGNVTPLSVSVTGVNIGSIADGFTNTANLHIRGTGSDNTTKPFFVENSTGSPIISVTNDKKIKIGGSSAATSFLELATGTATTGTSPLKFISGTLLTTPENGAVEADANNLYYTAGGVRQVLSVEMREEIFTATAGQTVFTLTGYTPAAVSGTNVPIRVYRNGVRLFWVASGPTSTQFTYTGTTVTTTANLLNDVITVEYLN